MISPLRQFLYQKGVLKTVELPSFVVSVGNISLGGTGKSPFVLFMAQWFLERGVSVGVLSRGYKRKFKSLQILPPGGSLTSAEEIGDEPWMIKNRLPDISLLVHADRARMAARHWHEFGEPKLVLLDDGFQHWKASRDRDVLMLDATESLSQGQFPFGRLREGPPALARADLIVVTRARALSEESLLALLQKIKIAASAPIKKPWKRAAASSLQIVCADYAFSHFFGIADGEPCDPPPPSASVVLVSGVAKPDGVRAMVKSLGIHPKEEIYFPDHYRLKDRDVFLIKRSLKAHGPGACLMITEKDWARWQTDLYGIPGFGVSIAFDFLGDGESRLQSFFEEIKTCII